MCTGSEAGPCSEHPGKSEESRVAGAEWVRGDVSEGGS